MNECFHRFAPLVEWMDLHTTSLISEGEDRVEDFAFNASILREMP